MPPAGRADQRSPFKAATRPSPAPTASPETTSTPGERGGERARREQNPRGKATTSASPGPLARTASPSPSRDPQSRRRFLAGRSDPHCGVPAWGCRFRGQQFSGCCCCCESRDSIGRTRAAAKARALRGLVTSQYQSLLLLPPYADFGVPCDLFDLLYV